MLFFYFGVENCNESQHVHFSKHNSLYTHAIFSSLIHFSRLLFDSYDGELLKKSCVNSI